MGLVTVTGPTSEPITLIEARQQCKIDDTTDDGLIAGYILAAREFVENSTHLRLVTQTLDYTVDFNWPSVRVGSYCRTRIELPVQPVASITSVSYVDSAGATQTLTVTSQYVAYLKGPVAYIEPAYGVSWPSVRWQPEAITVRFVAGWANSDCPHTIMQALRMLVRHYDANREAFVAGTLTEVPLGVEALLSQNRFARVA